MAPFLALWARLARPPLVATVASVVVVLLVGVVHGQVSPDQDVSSPTKAASVYIGSGACLQCHAVEAAAWSQSQHAHAMQPATDVTVLGDFDDAQAGHFASRARFFRRDRRFVVATEGRDGRAGEFVVAFTFGLAPLQQYLTEFPDGRIQAIPYAWDTRPKGAGGQRWIHLYPDEAIPPGDPLHWTGPQQNWNFMCADCHSTAVRKAYEAASDRFATTSSEVGVGCESCHGPGSGHVEWAAGPRNTALATKGFASVAARRPTPDWTPNVATGSPAHGVTRPANDEVDVCATCHARRGQFAEGWRPGLPIADFYRPALLTPDLFEDDGQMREEVFNDQAFKQSRMYAKGVVCTDCHDPHSGKLKADGAAICSQCHLPQVFATARHSGHEPGPGQPDCVSCHMPARTYMVVDTRHDHSFRVPRPDLTVALGTPNVCAECHRDRTPAWALQAIERLHGPTRKGFQSYAAAFHAARTGQPEARALLAAVARDSATLSIGRATALLLLQSRPSAEVDALMSEGLRDPDPSVRIAALGGLAGLPADQRWRRAAPYLRDPVRAVRMEAAVRLAEGPPANVPQEDREAFGAASAEYEAAERHNADRAESWTNLGHFHVRAGRWAEAEQDYLAAMGRTSSVGPRVDLADLYRATGREKDAEQLLTQTIAIDPRSAAAHHALGLSLIRQKRYPEAIERLRQATDLAPGQARYAFVYAVALQAVGRATEARAMLVQALQASPSDIAVLTALLQDAFQRRDPVQALTYAERLRALSPDDANLPGLVGRLREATASQQP